jgi:hypothetical protein
VITGIAPFGRHMSSLSAAAVGGYPRPEALAISVRAPGSLLFTRAGGTLGRFAAGAFATAQATPFHSRALGADLIARISTHEPFISLKNSYWHWYSAALDHLLRSASGRGHGGSIIWVPREHAAVALTQTRLGVRIAEFTAVYDSFIEVVRRSVAADERRRSIFEARDVVAAGMAGEALTLSMRLPDVKVNATTLLNALAQITCVDGATIIDDHFEPLIFRARLSAAEWTGPVRLGPTARSGPGEAVTRGRFGTRHNSAIDFVAAIPGAVGFVISQDGPVRGITRRGDTVFLWPDCLSTMFVD